MFKWFTKFLHFQDEMIALPSQPMPEGSIPLIDEEICNQVLGRRPGYVCDLGHGVVPASSLSSSSVYFACDARVQEADKRAKEPDRRAHELDARGSAQQQELYDIRARQAQMESLLQSLMS